MKISVNEDRNELVITLGISPRPSKSGKTTVIATSSGNQTFSDVQFQGKPLTVGVNAYIPK